MTFVIASFLPSENLIYWGLPLFSTALIAVAGFRGWRKHLHRRFFFRFNILWDKKSQPFCPGCLSPLTDWQKLSSWKFANLGSRTVRNRITYQAFLCRKCRKILRLTDEDGFELTFAQARERLRSPADES